MTPSSTAPRPSWPVLLRPTAEKAAVDALVAAFLEKHPNHRGPVIVLPEQFETPEEWEAWYQAQDEMDSV